MPGTAAEAITADLKVVGYDQHMSQLYLYPTLPDDAIRSCEVVHQNVRSVRIRGHAGHVKDTSCSFVGFEECKVAMTPPGAAFGPIDCIESSTSAPPPKEPGRPWIATSVDSVRQRWHKELF